MRRFIPVVVVVLVVALIDRSVVPRVFVPPKPHLASNEREITIPEGWTSKQIAHTLAEAGIVHEEEFLKFSITNFQFPINFQIPNFKLEGFLFPDTYRFFLNTPVKEVIGKMVAQFETQVLPIVNQSKRPPYDVLRMASIVEAEVANKDDRSIVAGILWKRFDAGMGLNVDSTLNYVTGNNSPALSARELKIDSPYNTYKHRGLPPTPIGNPGIEAIRAAVEPTTSPYWYFLTGLDEKTYYAATLDAHVKNKRNYLK